MPLMFEHTVVRFTAGPTNYEMSIHLPGNRHEVVMPDDRTTATTVGQTLTHDQRLLICWRSPANRPFVATGGRRPRSPRHHRPRSTFGWTTTKFTRKLDNVCHKLAATGVRGLHGRPGVLASNRRARLVGTRSRFAWSHVGMWPNSSTVGPPLGRRAVRTDRW